VSSTACRVQAPIIATDAEGLVLPLLVTVSRAGYLKQSLGPTMVVAAGLEPSAVPISRRAEGNQVLADGQADRQDAEGRE
jgi:hypothetical protein